MPLAGRLCGEGDRLSAAILVDCFGKPLTNGTMLPSTS